MPASESFPTFHFQGRLAERPPLSLRLSVMLIGSGEQAQFRLKSSAVAPAHVLLVHCGGQTHLCRLPHTPALQLNLQPLHRASLQQGDRLRIAGLELHFEPALRSDGAATEDLALSATASLELEIQTQDSADAGPRRLKLHLPITLLGSDGDCDVVLPGQGVLPVHAALCCTDAGVVVRALDPGAPVHRNGKATVQSPCRPGDVLTLGTAKIRFLGTSAPLPAAVIAPVVAQGPPPPASIASPEAGPLPVAVAAVDAPSSPAPSPNQPLPIASGDQIVSKAGVPLPAVALAARETQVLPKLDSTPAAPPVLVETPAPAPRVDRVPVSLEALSIVPFSRGARSRPRPAPVSWRGWAIALALLLGVAGIYAIWRWVPVTGRIEGTAAFDVASNAGSPAKLEPLRAAQETLLRDPRLRQQARLRLETRQPGVAAGFLDQSDRGQRDLQMGWRTLPGGWEMLTVTLQSADAVADQARLDVLLAVFHEASATQNSAAAPAALSSADRAREQLKIDLLKSRRDELAQQVLGLERGEQELKAALRAQEAQSLSAADVALLQKETQEKEAAFLAAARDVILGQLQLEHIKAALAAPITRFNVLAATPADPTLSDLVTQREKFIQAMERRVADAAATRPSATQAIAAADDVGARQEKILVVEKQIRDRLEQLAAEVGRGVEQGQKNQHTRLAQYLASRRRFDESQASTPTTEKRHKELKELVDRLTPLRDQLRRKNEELATAELSLTPREVGSAVRLVPPAPARVLEWRDWRWPLTAAVGVVTLIMMLFFGGMRVGRDLEQARHHSESVGF